MDSAVASDLKSARRHASAMFALGARLLSTRWVASTSAGLGFFIGATARFAAGLFAGKAFNGYAIKIPLNANA
jgi:hypothetical protein